MIICCCNKAAELCADTCSRWKGAYGPDKIYLILQWPKDKNSIQAAIDYAKSLDWPEGDDDSYE